MSISEVKNQFIDLLRANMYEVTIEPPAKLGIAATQEMMKYLTTTASFPFETITPKEVEMHSRRYSVANNATYDPISLTFALDSQGKVLDFFQRWSKLIIDDNHMMGYYDDYVGKIRIKLLDRQKTDIYGVTLIDAYPVNRADMAIAAASENTVLDLTISFVYLKTEYDYLGEGYTPSTYQPTDAATIYRQSRDGSPLSDDYLIFSPGERKLAELLQKEAGKIKLPDIGGLNFNMTSFGQGDLSRQFQGMAQDKMKEFQDRIMSQYKDIQQKTVGRLQNSVSKAVGKIFKF